MKHTNKFTDGQAVVLLETDEVLIVDNVAYAPSKKRYTYAVKEHPHTFYFEDELRLAN